MRHQRVLLRAGLVLLALLAHELLARHLGASDLLDQLLVEKQLSTALLAGVLAILRLYLMLVLPARIAVWAFAYKTTKARVAAPQRE